MATNLKLGINFKFSLKTEKLKCEWPGVATNLKLGINFKFSLKTEFFISYLPPFDIYFELVDSG